LTHLIERSSVGTGTLRRRATRESSGRQGNGGDGGGAPGVRKPLARFTSADGWIPAFAGMTVERLPEGARRARSLAIRVPP